MNGGRWNSPGIAVIYAADSRALAAFEILTRTGRATLLEAFDCVGISFAEALVTSVDQSELPRSWRSIPPGQATRLIGDAWVGRAESAVLRIPSVVIPAEYNYMLNPAHPDYRQLTIGDPVPFAFDPRLA